MQGEGTCLLSETGCAAYMSRFLHLRFPRSILNLPRGVLINFQYKGSIPLLGIRNLTLNPYLGSMNNNTKIRLLWSANLKKEIIMHFGGIHYCGPFNK